MARAFGGLHLRTSLDSSSTRSNLHLRLTRFVCNPTPSLLHLGILCVVLCASSFAQQYPYAGFPLFSTQVGSQYDQIDIADGNISLQLPFRSITSGPLPLNYTLFGQSNAFVSTQDNGGEYWTVTTPSFALLSNMGAQLGYTLDQYSQNCNGVIDHIYSNFYVTDVYSTNHPLNIPTFDSGGCYTFSPGIYPSTDGSGYTVVLSGTGSSPSTALFDKYSNEYNINYNGTSTVQTVVTPDAVTAQTISKTIPASPPGNCGSGYPCTYNITYTDDLTGNPIATYDYSANVSRFPTTVTYSYTNSAGNTISPPYSVTYSSYNVATSFGCSGVVEIGPASGVAFISSITAPNGGVYSFTYEPTPNKSGYVTGRIASITLPSGGSISYSYSGGSNGITCTSSVIPTLTRKVADNNGHVETWKYVNSNTSPSITANYTVVVTDPANNQTLYYMQGQAQTQVISFQGGCTPTTVTGCNGSGTVLKTVTNCYNAVFTNCAAPTQPIGGPPFTQTDVYTSYNSGSSDLVETKYNSFGEPTEVRSYDFGVNTGAAPTNTPLSDTLTYYGQSWNGTSCTAYPSGVYIYTTPCYSYTNSAGTPVAKTQVTYSNTGHPLSTAKWTNGSSWLTSTATYNSNGTIATSKDVNGAITQYFYNGTGGCSGLLLTSTAFALDSLTTSQAWNCDGDVLTSSTDANGQVTEYGYVNEAGTPDPLWRRLSLKDPLLNVTWTDYSPGGTLPETVETYLNFPVSSPTATVDTQNTLDGLGRVVKSQKRTAPGGSTFDSAVSYTYGWTSTGSVTGSFMTQTIPGGSALTTTQHDALGRTASVTDGGGGSTSYAYSNNDVLLTLGPAPSGENPKKRQLEYDGLGRIKSVCELTSAANGGGTCGQTSPQTGYWTNYSYDALNNLLSVSQNAQSSHSQGRTFVYDGLSRLTSEANPESGTTTYTYDSYPSGTCGGWTSEPGDLMLRINNDGSQVCYVHDALHRVTDTGTSAATGNVCRRFRYDTVSNAVQAEPTGFTTTGSNLDGQVVEAETDSCTAYPPTSATMLTDEWFRYTPRAEQSDLFESTPNSGGYYHTIAGYWANGVVNTLNGVPGLSSWTFGTDGEGRLSSATYGTTTWVSDTTYYPSYSQTTVSFGTGDSDVYGFDASTGRMNQFKFTIGSTPESFTGAPAWNANWTLAGLTITDQFKSANQNCTYVHDDLLRIKSVNCVNGTTNVWNQTFTYDAFGNISKSGSSAFAASYLLANGNTNNQEQTVGSCAPAYDGRGNLTNDCTFSTPATYAWDIYGNPTSLKGVALTYDALGNEVQVGTTSEIIYSPLGKLGIMNGQAAATIRISLPGGSTAELIGSTGGLTHILHSDWLGSARISSLFHDRSEQYDTAYAPFGESYDGYSGDLDFTGSFQDTLSGLYDFTYRYDNPVQGRWISPDPAGLAAVDPTNPQSWNRYAYVLDNPLSNTDTTGLGGPAGSQPVVYSVCPIPAGQVQAVCQGGWGSSVPGGLWLTYGFDEFDNVIGWDCYEVCTSYIVQPPTPSAGFVCYIYIMLCGQPPRPNNPKPNWNNLGKNMNCKESAANSRSLAINSHNPSPSDILKTPNFIEAGIAGSLGSINPILKGAGWGAAAAGFGEAAAIGLGAAAIYNDAEWGVKNNAPFEAQQNAIYNNAVQQCDQQFPVPTCSSAFVPCG